MTVTEPGAGVVIRARDVTRSYGDIRALAGVDLDVERGEIVGTYDKHHLVPFGEYTPFRALLGLAKLTVGATDFSPGPGLRTIELPGLPPVSPLICYEAIFSGRVTDPGARPDWLLNITKDRKSVV